MNSHLATTYIAGKMWRHSAQRCFLTAQSVRIKNDLLRPFSNMYIDGKPKVAGRIGLLGSEGANMPITLSPTRENFPHIFDVTKPNHGFQSAKLSDVAVWGGEFEQYLNSLLDAYGAVLIRGLPIDGGSEFSKLMSSFAAKPMQYVGGISARKNVHKNVDTASDDPPSVTIELHNEMSYSTEYPKQVITAT